ncbi:MAG: GH32 C-terminal domain-containing protein, partial [Bacteroidota bacterium]|nr:GH32 C-terminal domain-containing protein [Bacteroidota bacterium]
YDMLLAARFKKGIPRRRGLTALCASKDLVKWEVREPFYAPDLYFTHECPDLFKMGDWWYLLFSEFTDLVKTRYRMARSLKGPWIIPEKDDFDGHAFYAAKTASDGNRRFLFGWNPTRHEAKDNGSWDWGGNLVVHEIHQNENGELSVRVPETVKAAFSRDVEHKFVKGAGDVLINGETIDINVPGTFGAAVAGRLPDTCKIEGTVVFEKNTKECGFILRSSEDLEKAYYIRLEPRNNRLVFDMWPRNRSEVTRQVELDRSIHLVPGTPFVFQIFIDGNKGVVYVNDSVAMNFRAYDLPEGNWGVFASEGSAQFNGIRMSTL